MTKPLTVADVDPALADALRAWAARHADAYLASEEERALADALRAYERDPMGGQRRRVLFALRDARNDRATAAEALGVSVRTLLRWMRDLGIWELADRQAEIHGWPVLPHKPRA